MRVKSIVIDGFKSYAHRKELADLSRHFNAITGFNGSGKSNIFDAICFVMGITNLKKVRAEDPRELIFRAGTTGVHAARVTMEFLNDDPATAPPGYSCEDYPIITVGRQIKLGGKQQFFFNNTVSMQSKVKRFFESISLNVDNPHFMVLQGTVHKLIGMKPQDILALVEEAVGTKAFDHRRRTAEALIRGKERKMKEIDDNIETQIGPMLETMKADQEEYERLLKVSEGLEQRRKFRIAFEYYERQQLLQSKQQQIAHAEEHVKDAKFKLSDIPSQEDALTRQVMSLQDKLGQPAETAIALHAEEVELKKSESRLQTQLESCTKQIRRIDQQMKLLHKERERQHDVQERFAARKAEQEQLVLHIKVCKDNIAKLKVSLQLSQSGVRAGKAGVSLEEERREVELQIIQHDAAWKRACDNVQQLTSELETAKQHNARQFHEIHKWEREREKAQHVYNEATHKFEPIAQHERRFRAMDEEITQAKMSYQRLYEEIQRESGNRSYDLDYDHHTRSNSNNNNNNNILESAIRGRVAELLYPAEDKYTMALLVGAQTMLLRVVVDSDNVAEELIQRGLRQRTTFVALNKLQTIRKVTPEQLQAAQRVVEERNKKNKTSNDNNINSMESFVLIAKSAITYDKDNSFSFSSSSSSTSNNNNDHNKFNEQMNQLIEHVFGNFVICSDLELAQDLAYNPAIRVKAVTLDGEVVEPNGLMTGGSTSHLRNYFAELQSYRLRRQPLRELTAHIHSLERERIELQDEMERHVQIIEQFRYAEEELESVTQKLELAQSGTRNVVEEMESSIREEQAHMAEHDAIRNTLQSRKAEIDQELSIDLDKAQRQLRSEQAAEEHKLHALLAQESAEAAEFEKLEADTEQMMTDNTNKMQEAESELAQQQSDNVHYTTQLLETQKRMAEVQERGRETELLRQQLEKGIDDAQSELTKLTQVKASLENIIKNAEVDLKEWNRICNELQHAMHNLTREHDWIKSEESSFGDADGVYYFTDKARTNSTLQELREAEAQAAVLSKRMNRKATVLYDDRKREYEELVKQRAALSEDKTAIQACIAGIEQRKWQALDRMVSVVSSIFGKLFSACLPGANAELMDERDEMQHLCGLNVRVLFNGKAKESLSELSGGQRSLLALCLILSLLRVRPAPIYILDEVDAALDPSHTQNIGRMLQLYFPNSQFLLVSLKDGMFNNANVLYHVRNTQGYSEISRIERRADNNNNNNNSNSSNNTNRISDGVADNRLSSVSNNEQKTEVLVSQ